MPVCKGTELNTYRVELKTEAMRLQIEEGWTYRQITDYLKIYDKDRVKRWMRKV